MRCCLSACWCGDALLFSVARIQSTTHPSEQRCSSLVPSPTTQQPRTRLDTRSTMLLLCSTMRCLSTNSVFFSLPFFPSKSPGSLLRLRVLNAIGAALHGLSVSFWRRRPCASCGTARALSVLPYLVVPRAFTFLFDLESHADYAPNPLFFFVHTPSPCPASCMHLRRAPFFFIFAVHAASVGGQALPLDAVDGGWRPYRPRV